MRIIAIIPARAGSKGIKNKNLKKIGNKTLVEHTINQAKSSRYINMIAVSTDSKKIQTICKGKKKVWCDYLRPKNISGDRSRTSDAILFTLNKINKEFDYIIELHPTHVFRKVEIIDKAIEIILKNKRFDSLISIIEIKSTAHPDYVINLRNNYSINYKNSPARFNRHNLSKKYMSAGIILISKVSSFLRNKSMCSKKCYGFVINDFLTEQNLDSDRDLKIAKIVWRNYVNKKY
jgi:CMP-N-acetylneuraminic acid synthetase